MDDKLVMKHLGVLVTTFCNLNCRNCADGMPVMRPYIYSYEEIKKDFLVLLEAVDEIQEVLVIGGELLLHPDLGRIIRFFGSLDKVGKIVITTNGTIAPSTEILQELHAARVEVRVSGYPYHVAPKRRKIIGLYRTAGLTVADFDQMQWCDIGGNEYRDRKREELAEVFSSCGMKECVTLVRGGRIIFCSRQHVAFETDLYPRPLNHEYVNIYDSYDLRSSIRKFYETESLSTCNYCDGISCATKRNVPAGIQILPKKAFLELLSQYASWGINEVSIDQVEAVKKLCFQNSLYFIGIKEYDDFVFALNMFNETDNAGIIAELRRKFLLLVNVISGDYSCKTLGEAIIGLQTKTGDKSNPKNLISVGDGTQAVDVQLERGFLLQYWNSRFAVDIFAYTYFFIKAKLAKLAQEDIRCIVSGLSYTQYGIIESVLKYPAVNLSITAQDIPYSLRIAEKALELSNTVDIVIIPMAVYQGFYDMSDDGVLLHQEVVKRVNAPLLEGRTSFAGELSLPCTEKLHLKLFEQVADFGELNKLVESHYIDRFKNRDFFNEFFDYPPMGGLKFDFKSLLVEERYERAKITERHNQRAVMGRRGMERVISCWRSFLEKATARGIKTYIFTPPQTKYLYAARNESLCRQFLSEVVEPVLSYGNARYCDFSHHEWFEDEDFCDFEHLNHSGAVKLTKLLSEWIN